MSVASKLIQCAEADKGFFKNCVNGNETQMYGYEPETNRNHQNGKHLHHHDYEATASFMQGKGDAYQSFAIKDILYGKNVLHKAQL